MSLTGVVVAKHSKPRNRPDHTTWWVRIGVFLAVVAVALVTEDAFVVGSVTFLALVVLGWTGPWPWFVRDKDPPSE